MVLLSLMHNGLELYRADPSFIIIVVCAMYIHIMAGIVLVRVHVCDAGQ